MTSLERPIRVTVDAAGERTEYPSLEERAARATDLAWLEEVGGTHHSVSEIGQVFDSAKSST